MSDLVLGKRVEGGTEILCVCPQCGKEKLYVSARKYRGICFYCNLRLGPKALANLTVTTTAPDTSQPQKVTTIPRLVNAWEYPESSDYLRYVRGMKPHDNYGIRYDPSSHRFWFNIYSPDDLHSPSYHTRGIGGGWIVMEGTEKSHYWYGGPYFGKAVLVEGIFDAMRLGRGAVALLGTKLSETHLFGLKRTMLTKQQVLVWLDPDEPGQKAAREIVKRLRDNGFDANNIVDDHEPADCECKRLALVKKWLIQAV